MGTAGTAPLPPVLELPPVPEAPPGEQVMGGGLR
jgi:hypothetical protein